MDPKRRIKKEEVIRTSKEAEMFNDALVAKAKVLGFITGGMVAGTLGLEGVQGFIFYFITHIICSACICFSLNFTAMPFFKDLSAIMTGNIFTNLLSYLLFWVMFYNLIYVL
ncbi:unnamed protein product [Moneuplotes crassus]|uniref:ER membrane protein complex subunit 6 n=1 Tax=Euplotes crassus TaxID=5936 RepID=A0AAD1Y9A0_EUPCR|nr:unnamed protein product [Moneuplotes crassus]